MTIRPSQRKAVAKYNAANYDRVELRIPKGRKQDIEAFAKSKGESVNGFINLLLYNAMGLSAEEWKQKETDE